MKKLMMTIIALALTVTYSAVAQVIVPVDLQGSTSNGVLDDWGWESLQAGVELFDQATGTNGTQGLEGYTPVPAVANSAGMTHYPHHGDFAAATHWLSAYGPGGVFPQWIEFELPNNMPLEQVWIWNGANGDFAVRNVEIQTASFDPGPGQLGSVTYDVTHYSGSLPPSPWPERSPALVQPLPDGTVSRYVRLNNMFRTDEFGTPVYPVTLAEVFILQRQEQDPIENLQAQIDNLQDQINNIPAGPQGDQGKPGDQGSQGKAGDQGEQGTAGADAPCVDCPTLTDAIVPFACKILAANPPTSVQAFDDYLDAIVDAITLTTNVCTDKATCIADIKAAIDALK